MIKTEGQNHIIDVLYVISDNLVSLILQTDPAIKKHHARLIKNKLNDYTKSNKGENKENLDNMNLEELSALVDKEGKRLIELKDEFDKFPPIDEIKRNIINKRKEQHDIEDSLNNGKHKLSLLISDINKEEISEKLKEMIDDFKNGEKTNSENQIYFYEQLKSEIRVTQVIAENK